jgi:hemin uptake protein HemP
MIAVIDQIQPAPAKRPRPNLCLHCGAHVAERGEVQRVPTPHATKTWTPIPHFDLITLVERTLKTNGLIIGQQAHSLTHDGARYFGLMEIQRTEFDEDYCWVLGLRNSHDKTFPAGIVAGAQTFVCDNLSFSGEVKLTRKHTRFIVRDLPGIVQSAIGKLMDRWHHQDTRLSIYKLTELDDRTAHDLVIRAVDVGTCPNQLIPRVLHEWREPFHEAFRLRNVWSLFNAFTEVLKGNLSELPRRTEALHGLLDTHVGLHSPS